MPMRTRMAVRIALAPCSDPVIWVLVTTLSPAMSSPGRPSNEVGSLTGFCPQCRQTPPTLAIASATPMAIGAAFRGVAKSILAKTRAAVTESFAGSCPCFSTRAPAALPTAVASESTPVHTLRTLSLRYCRPRCLACPSVPVRRLTWFLPAELRNTAPVAAVYANEPSFISKTDSAND